MKERFNSLRDIAKSFDIQFKRLGWNICVHSCFDTEAQDNSATEGNYLPEYSITFKCFSSSHEKDYLRDVLLIYNSTVYKLEQLCRLNWLSREDLRIEIVSNSSGDSESFYVYPQIKLTCKKQISSGIFNTAKEIFEKNCQKVVYQLSLIKRPSDFLIDVAYHIYNKWLKLYGTANTIVPYCYGHLTTNLTENLLSLYLLLIVARFPQFCKSSCKIVNNGDCAIFPVIREECLLGDNSIHHYSFRYVDVNPLPEEVEPWVDRLLNEYSAASIAKNDNIVTILKNMDRGEVSPNYLRIQFLTVLAEIDCLKQVIVVRKDLNLTPGLLAAFVAQASDAFLLDVISSNLGLGYLDISCLKMNLAVGRTYKKVFLCVNNEQELRDLLNKVDALSTDIPQYQVFGNDIGITQQSTLVGVSLGPCSLKTMDKLTGHLEPLI